MFQQPTPTSFDGVWPMASQTGAESGPMFDSQMWLFSFHLAGPVVVLG